MKTWIRTMLVAASLASVALAPLAEADAALSAYLKLKGQKQGQIKGSVTQKGREDMIMVVAFNHEIVSPRDAASGLPTGKRQHKPLVITKEIDRASPLLYNALTFNENLPELTLTVYQPRTKGGAEAPAYTIRLANASIASIRTRTDDQGAVLEDISFTYQRIEWTVVDGGVTTVDAWGAGPRGGRYDAAAAADRRGARAAPCPASRPRRRRRDPGHALARTGEVVADGARPLP